MNKKNLLLFALLGLFAFSFVGCSEATEEPTPTTTTSNSIVDVAISNNFTILVQALERVNLTETLKGEGPFTVFAPTDDAFTALLAELNATSLDDISDDVLTQVLLNHVVGGKVLSTDLTAGYVSTLASGPQETNISLLVDLTDRVSLNNRAKVITANVEADNGVVHVIDRVLTIPNVVDAALANPQFSILVQALTRADLTEDFVATLSTEGPFTIFAPTNDAFVALLNSNPAWSALSDVPVATLEAVLKYHVIAGATM
jgi:transforming growth factor-beta-induced protein